MHVEADLARALDRLAGDALRAPVHIFEQAAMRTLDSRADNSRRQTTGRSRSDRPVAPTLRRSRSTARSAGSGCRNSARRRRHGRRQRVPLMAENRQSPKFGYQASISPIPRGKVSRKKRLPSPAGRKPCSRRSSTLGPRGACCRLQVRRYVLEEGRVESSSLLGTQRRHKPGLGAPRLGRFRHDGNTTAPTSVRLDSHEPTPVDGSMFTLVGVTNLLGRTIWFN